MLSTSAVDVLQQQIQRQLATLVQRNAEGGDSAPAARSRLEGWMESALLLADADAAQLIVAWQSQLPTRSRLQCEIVEGVWRVHLDLWQTRAPVVPTTRD